MKAQRKANGSWFIQPSINGRRVLVTLGKIKPLEARRIAGNIETILSFQRLGRELPAEVQQWIDGLSTEFRKRLAGKGVVTECKVITFNDLCNQFLKTYDREQSTIKRMKRSVRIGQEVFGKTICDEITAKQVLQYDKRLKSDLSESTWTKSLSDTKQVFNWGIKQQLIRNNPVADLRGGRKSNPNRMIYVTKEDIGDVLDIATGDWKLIFGLARFAGLRVPSEFVRLRWENVDFAKNILKVYAQKTRKPRLVPIFAPLDAIIRDAFESLPDRTPKRQHLIQAENRRQPESNLRTEAMKLIDRAGVDVWEKLFQNLRMSCATDLLNAGYPVTKVADWLGHSVAVLLEHYKGTTGREIQEAREVNNDPFLIGV